MNITLAIPTDGHNADETIEVDDDRGRQLIADGWARPADEAPPAAPAGNPRK